MTNEDTKRYIPPGSCTWCGHKPHDDGECTSTVRTRFDPVVPCPCARTRWARRQR